MNRGREIWRNGQLFSLPRNCVMLVVMGLSYKPYRTDGQQEAEKRKTPFSWRLPFPWPSWWMQALPQQACPSSARFNWAALGEDGWKPGDFKAHCLALGLWGFIPITGPRKMHSNDNLLSTHGPLEVTGWGGRRALRILTASLSLSPERATLWDPRTWACTGPLLAGQWRERCAPRWGHCSSDPAQKPGAAGSTPGPGPHSYPFLETKCWWDQRAGSHFLILGMDLLFRNW